MSTRRALCLLLVLALVLGASCSAAAEEGVPGSVLLEKTPVLSIHVDYEDEEPEGDTKLNATIRVDLTGGQPVSAEDVTLELTPGNGLVLLQGQKTVPLGGIASGGSAETVVQIGYDESKATETDEFGDYVPTLDIEARSANLGRCAYHAKFDVTPKARAVIYGSDHTEDEDAEDAFGPISAAITKGARKARYEAYERTCEIWRDAYYGGKRVTQSQEFKDPDFDAFIAAGVGSPDANDITYVFLSSHGSESGDFITDSYLDTFDTFLDDDETPKYYSHTCSCEEFLQTLGALDGRVVLVVSMCYAGQFMEHTGLLDARRFCLITCTDGDTSSRTGQFSTRIQHALDTEGFAGKDVITCADLMSYLQLVDHQDLSAEGFAFDQWFLDAWEAYCRGELNELELIAMAARISGTAHASAFTNWLNSRLISVTDLVQLLLTGERYDAAKGLTPIEFLEQKVAEIDQFFLGDAQVFGNTNIPFRVQSPAAPVDYLPMVLKEETGNTSRLMLGGVVRDARSKQPLEDATVRLFLNGGKLLLEKQTVMNGVWQVASCETDTVVEFSKPGYQTRTFTFAAEDLKRGTPVDLFSVELTPGPLPVAFSYDPLDDWHGTLTLYALDSDEHLISESSDAPELWRFRRMLTDTNFAYRPWPVDEPMVTRISALRTADGLVLVQYDNGLDAIGAGAPYCRDEYTLYRLDPSEGISVALSGTHFGYFSMDARGSETVYPREEKWLLNEAECGAEEFARAFAEYGISFEQADLIVNNEGWELIEAYPRAVCEEGEVLLPELQSAVNSKLPPSYGELVQMYGLAE